jgi:hypothetical protein
VAGPDSSVRLLPIQKETFDMFRKALLAFVFLALGSVAVMAADFNGKWTADFTTPRGAQTVTFDFHVDGAKLTGKVTSQRGESEISDGKIDGDNISFSQVLNFNGNEMKVTYTGKIDGDTIKLTRQMGDRPAMDIVAKRVK